MEFSIDIEYKPKSFSRPVINLEKKIKGAGEMSV